MYTKQSKKMLPFDVLDILQRYTDVNHRLSQKEIEKILVDKYDMVVDRRSIKRSIMDLIEMGLEIQYSEIIRTVSDKRTGEEEEQAILTDFYIERDFSDCEIRLLIDELLDTKYVPDRQRRQLISKLEGLSSVYFRKRRGDARETGIEGANSQLFYTLDIVDEAIASCSKVSFQYKIFKVGENGRVEADYDTYVVTPHDMKVIDGEYLLICNEDGKEGITLRIDYISDIYIMNERGYRKHRDKRLMRNESSVKFVASEDELHVFVETFGLQAIRIERNGEGIVLVIKTEEKKAVEFGIMHSDSVSVISPENVRNAIVNRLRSGIDRYLAY